MSFDFSTLITDRSKADVSAFYSLLAKPLYRWTTEEIDAFNNGLLKGGYWWTDLNRVTACMEYLDAELEKLGYETGYEPVIVHFDSEPVVNKYTWLKEDKPTISQLDQYLENIEKIKSTLADIPTNPDAPSEMRKLSVEAANNIEKILLNLNTMIENMKHTINLGWALGIADVGLYGGV